MITIWCTENPGLVDEAFIMYFLVLISRNEKLTSNKILRYYDENNPNTIQYKVVNHDIADNVEAIKKWFMTTYFAKYIIDVQLQYGEWQVAS